MLKTEIVTINNQTFYHTFSDSFCIRKVGTDEVYSDCYDLTQTAYEETDTPLPTAEPTETDMRDALGILGVMM